MDLRYSLASLQMGLECAVRLIINVWSLIALRLLAWLVRAVRVMECVQQVRSYRAPQQHSSKAWHGAAQHSPTLKT